MEDLVAQIVSMPVGASSRGTQVDAIDTQGSPHLDGS